VFCEKLSRRFPLVSAEELKTTAQQEVIISGDKKTIYRVCSKISTKSRGRISNRYTYFILTRG
jgi:hypothetical protein